MIRNAIRFLNSLLRRTVTDSAAIVPTAPVLGEQSVCVVETDSPIAGKSHGGEKSSMVTRESLGIETLGGVFTPLISSGTRIPCAISEVFTTAANKQTEISVRLYRGNNPVASQNHALGNYSIIGLPPARRGEYQVRVTFRISDQKQVSLTAHDRRTQQPITIRRAE